MTRWELLSAAGRVMAGEYGNADKRKRKLGKNYGAIQTIVDTILEFEDSNSRRIAQLEDEIKKLRSKK